MSTYNATSSLVSSNMREVRHTPIECLEVLSAILVARIDVCSCTISEAFRLVELSRKAVVGRGFKGSDVLCPVCEGTSGHAVVDGRAVSAEVGVGPHFRVLAEGAEMDTMKGRCTVRLEEIS